MVQAPQDASACETAEAVSSWVWACAVVVVGREGGSHPEAGGAGICRNKGGSKGWLKAGNGAGCVLSNQEVCMSSRKAGADNVTEHLEPMYEARVLAPEPHAASTQTCAEGGRRWSSYSSGQGVPCSTVSVLSVAQVQKCECGREHKSISGLGDIQSLCLFCFPNVIADANFLKYLLLQ